MRILFIGSVIFSAKALKKLISLESDIVGVCTIRESEFNADHVDLSSIAEDAAIPVCIAPNINQSEVVEWVRGHCPDVIFCFGWSSLLGPEILGVPKLGVVGFHPSDLPANRGRHPIVWALVLGLSQTASTFFMMDEGVDSGDIISQVKVPIYEDDSAGDLYSRITEVAMRQLEEFLPMLESSKGMLCAHCQEPGASNSWRKRKPADGLIDWRMSARSIYNLVRALSKPYVGAQFEYGGHLVKVWKSSLETSWPENLEPGKVLSVDSSGAVIKAGEGAIRLILLDPVVEFTEGDYL